MRLRHRTDREAKNKSREFASRTTAYYSVCARYIAELREKKKKMESLIVTLSRLYGHQRGTEVDTGDAIGIIPSSCRAAIKLAAFAIIELDEAKFDQLSELLPQFPAS